MRRKSDSSGLIQIARNGIHRTTHRSLRSIDRLFNSHLISAKRDCRSLISKSAKRLEPSRRCEAQDTAPASAPPLRAGLDFLADWRAYGTEIIHHIATIPYHTTAGQTRSHRLSQTFVTSQLAGPSHPVQFPHDLAYLPFLSRISEPFEFQRIYACHPLQPSRLGEPQQSLQPRLHYTLSRSHPTIASEGADRDQCESPKRRVARRFQKTVERPPFGRW